MRSEVSTLQNSNICIKHIVKYLCSNARGEWDSSIWKLGILLLLPLSPLQTLCLFACYSIHSNLKLWQIKFKLTLQQKKKREENWKIHAHFHTNGMRSLFGAWDISVCTHYTFNKIEFDENFQFERCHSRGCNAICVVRSFGVWHQCDSHWEEKNGMKFVSALRREYISYFPYQISRKLINWHR